MLVVPGGCWLPISIHALLAESDAPWPARLASRFNFYPRSPCGERQGTASRINGRINFYPRSPCGERRVHYDNYNLHCVISIHALLAESDHPSLSGTAPHTYFYPRSPCGERRDLMGDLSYDRNFYPRSPCGERPCTTTITICTASFLSTLSLRRATVSFMLYDTSSLIFLSTLSLRRATCVVSVQIGGNVYFYPRSPCGERLIALFDFPIVPAISIHALLAESDWWLRCWQLAAQDISIHALLAESDNGGLLASVSSSDFYPRSPCGERPHPITIFVRVVEISIHALLAESD